MILKKIIKRWKAIKALLNCDEYFLGVSTFKNGFDVICYDYIKNTERDLFYNFVHDYIENNLRCISGDFICVRPYEDKEEGIFIPKGITITLNEGQGNLVFNKNENSDTKSYKIPNEEIFSHFKCINNYD